MGLKVVRDADTCEFTIDGDKLVLLSTPRYRDTLKVAELEEAEVMAALKSVGMDMTEAIEAAMKASPEERERAREANRSTPDSPAIREAKLKALAVRLVVDGEAFGGEAIIDAYRSMDVASAAWVDAQVASVWASASVSDAEREGQGAVSPDDGEHSATA